MTIKEAVTFYNKKKEAIKNLKLAQERIIMANSSAMRDPLGSIRIEEQDLYLFASLLSKEIKRLEAELERKFE